MKNGLRKCRTVGQRGKPKAGFPSLPTSPWKSLRDSHIPPAPTATAWESGNPKAGFPLSHAHSFTLKPKNHERRSIPGLIASLQAHLWIRKCCCHYAGFFIEPGTVTTLSLRFARSRTARVFASRFVSVSHRSANGGMPQQLFHRYKIGARLRQPRRERMPERMPGNVIESRLAAGLLETKPQVFPLATRLRVVENISPLCGYHASRAPRAPLRRSAAGLSSAESFAPAFEPCRDLNPPPPISISGFLPAGIRC